jgi:2-methylcitrate dehydratase PrpD
MSIQFTVAAVLVHGRLDDEVFRAFAADGGVAALARRVRLEHDAELASGYPQRQGAEVIVTLRDGRTVGRRSSSSTRRASPAREPRSLACSARRGGDRAGDRRA